MISVWILCCPLLDLREKQILSNFFLNKHIVMHFKFIDILCILNWSIYKVLIQSLKTGKRIYIRIQSILSLNR